MATSWEHLLSGYATNTLTDKEKRQLFEAALHDQTLFEALADEEALRAMLADPESRQRILASLEAKDHSGGVNEERGGWLGWFRQPSHLAWAGSLAALGLVLIFGWQMEKEWGPVVSREQETAKSPSTRDEVVFQAQKPPEEGNAPVRKEALERKAAQTEGIEAEPQSISEPASRVETNEVDRLRQIPAVATKESDAREKSQAMRRQRANEQVGHAPSLPSALDQPKDGRTVRPLADPEAPEEAMADKVPQATVPGRFADQAVGEASVSSPSAQELFNAASASLGDELISRKDTDQHTPGGTLRLEVKPSVKGKRSAEVVEHAQVSESISHSAMGIRYSFVRETKDGEDEEVESRQIIGNWSQIRLAVESNVSGYLYVLASLGNGKWQKLLPIDTAKIVKTEGWINVQSFQRVEFPLGQLTYALGKPVVSAITVLLSPEPLDDLGQWLGSEVDVSKLLFEQAEGAAVFVVSPLPELEKPLYFEIPFGTEGKN